jgi:hypothetical protein
MDEERITELMIAKNHGFDSGITRRTFKKIINK